MTYLGLTQHIIMFRAGSEHSSVWPSNPVAAVVESVPTIAGGSGQSYFHPVYRLQHPGSQNRSTVKYTGRRRLRWFHKTCAVGTMHAIELANSGLQKSSIIRSVARPRINQLNVDISSVLFAIRPIDLELSRKNCKNNRNVDNWLFLQGFLF